MEIGIKGSQTFTVKESMLAVNVGSGEVHVLATPMMVMAVEKTALQSVASFLDEGRTTVGIELKLSHTAATPEGMSFHAETELADISANGKILTFLVSVYDEKEKIGEGTHKRAIVNKNRFEAKAEQKKEGI